MRIFHCSGVGVQVADNVEQAERGRRFNTNPGAVRIRGNFFHQNQHGAGEGYGVAVTDGAYATIEQNVFDENRHAIAGGSRNDHALDYSGYTAHDNLILEGGGLHCLDNAATGGLIGGIVGGIVGVTWWAKSPVTNQWRYLNTMSERLPQLELKKVDNDAVFDVLLRPPPGESPRLYSKSGTGPWEPLPVTGGGIEPPVLL